MLSEFDVLQGLTQLLAVLLARERTVLRRLVHHRRVRNQPRHGAGVISLATTSRSLGSLASRPSPRRLHPSITMSESLTGDSFGSIYTLVTRTADSVPNRACANAKVGAVRNTLDLASRPFRDSRRSHQLPYRIPHLTLLSCRRNPPRTLQPAPSYRDHLQD